MLRSLLAFAFVTALSTTYAFASTGQDLVDNCTHAYPDATDNPKGVYCLEYITGFVDSMVLVKRTNGEPAALFCPSEGFTIGKALEAIMIYAKANPDSKREHVSVFANRALRTAFPCRVN